MQQDWPLQYFPFLTPENHSKESPMSEDYNCIAWACELNDRQLWPGSEDQEWPSDLPQEDTPETFIALFEREGYQLCNGPELEDGFLKIAIYTKDSDATHAARQLGSGRWTSKLGFDGVDIEHDDLENVERPAYGRATIFLRKARGES